MTGIFVDASALVAMIGLETDFEILANRLDQCETRMTSGIAWWEAANAISRTRGMSIKDAEAELRQFAEARSIVFVPIGRQEAQIALGAFMRFGKGRHPAALNMGDCFAYACAKANDARLLYKGDDFSKTDLA